MTTPPEDRYRRWWSVPRSASSSMIVLLAVAAAIAESAMRSPWSASGGYELSLYCGIGADVLTILLLAALMRWPGRDRRADQLLRLAAALFAAAVIYRIGIGVLDSILNANKPPFSLPSGPVVDPRIETAGRAAGVWLLALGAWRLHSARRALQFGHVMVGICILMFGIVVAILVGLTASLALFPDAKAAVLIAAFAALGWSALAISAAAGSDLLAAPSLIAVGAILMLGAAGLDALGLLATHRISGSGSYDTYVPVSVIRQTGWLLLCVGFTLISRSGSVRSPFLPHPSRVRSRGASSTPVTNPTSTR